MRVWSLSARESHGVGCADVQVRMRAWGAALRCARGLGSGLQRVRSTRAPAPAAYSGGGTHPSAGGLHFFEEQQQHAQQRRRALLGAPVLAGPNLKRLTGQSARTCVLVRHALVSLEPR